MKKIHFKDEAFEAFVKTLNRRSIPTDSVKEIVADIVTQVQTDGDQALIDLTHKFDKASLTTSSLWVSEAEIKEAEAAVEADVKAAVAESRANIFDFAEKSLRQDWSSQNRQGAEVGERFLPYDRVGIYIPGGKAPLVSTSLMVGAFAKAAGVPEIVAATPCGPDGKVNPDLLYALVQAGATSILKVGGAQAIAALAYGTESVKPVDKIFGPGNAFVVEAKRQVVGAVAIDLLPGPSEVLVIADDSANPAYVAADLLAQAEHGGDSEIAFFTPSESLVEKVEAEIKEQLKSLSRASYINEVLVNNTDVVITQSVEQAIQLSNDYAPEHLSLIVDTKIEDQSIAAVKTAGAIFIGNFSPVAVGDFIAGPSHTLPTGGAGKSFSGLRADQFQRRTSIVRCSQAAAIASIPFTDAFARVEGLDAHGASVSIRRS